MMLTEEPCQEDPDRRKSAATAHPIGSACLVLAAPIGIAFCHKAEKPAAENATPVDRKDRILYLVNADDDSVVKLKLSEK